MSGRAPGGKAVDTPRKQPFYLIDEGQAADLASFRLALKGIADLAYNEVDAEAGEIRADRVHLHALFEQLERRLGSILAPAGNGVMREAWIDPAITVMHPA